ncbi:MAG TPA: NADH-quinone oxidoreductase subunit A [Opitutales bacterium]|nr:NADH-quinone oxidoreductase subunit A [Opitutales bacterium]
MIQQAATTPESFIPVLLQILLAVAIAVGLIVVSHIFGQRVTKRSEFAGTPYECGLPAQGNPHPRFAVKFYLTAMLFIIFDIEVVYLFPMATVYRSLIAAGIPILMPVLFFVLVLVAGLVYEIRKGALKWEGR